MVISTPQPWTRGRASYAQCQYPHLNLVHAVISATLFRKYYKIKIAAHSIVIWSTWSASLSKPIKHCVSNLKPGIGSTVLHKSINWWIDNHKKVNEIVAVIKNADSAIYNYYHTPNRKTLAKKSHRIAVFVSWCTVERSAAAIFFTLSHVAQ